MDSKHELLHDWERAEEQEQEGQDRQRRRGKILKLSLLSVLLGALLWFFFWSERLQKTVRFSGHWNQDDIPEPFPVDAGEKMIWDYNEIVPSEKLKWYPCFDMGQCARLTVPMDYNRPLNAAKDHPKVHLALSWIPGTQHAQTGKISTSPLLLNPGGPGGPGAMFALGVGEQIQKIVSTDRSQDIVGFDPRGVGYTIPSAECWAFPSHGKEVSVEDVKEATYHQFIWAMVGAEIPLINSSNTALAHRDRRARTHSQLCNKHDGIYGEDSILRHLSTPAVAQDMLSIVDAWDEWRVEMQQVALDETTSKDAESNENGHSLNTQGKLVYWGFSYGTLLGATFAAMFPDRVGRIVLDGVVDADYYVSPVWVDSLRDTDSIAHKFNYYCHKAGPLCAIYRGGDTEDAIGARVTSVFENLQKNPFIGLSKNENLPFSFGYDELKSITFGGLYNPIVSFPLIAQIFDILYRGDDESLLDMFPVNYGDYRMFCDNSTNSFLPSSPDATLAIMCSDKRYPLNETLPNLERRFAEMVKVSRYADIWMGVMIGCDAWNITPTDPPMRWDDHPAHQQKPIKTSFPLLFLSNTADPVTPLFAGVKMARKFVHAGLVEQKSEGHCSLAATSRCTTQWLRGYFEKGEIPSRPRWGPDGEELEKGVWARCEADEQPWKRFDSEVWMLEFEAEHRRKGAGDFDTLELQVALVKEWNEVKSMEAWRGLQDMAQAYIGPRSVTGERLRSLW